MNPTHNMWNNTTVITLTSTTLFATTVTKAPQANKWAFPIADQSNALQADGELSTTYLSLFYDL